MKVTLKDHMGSDLTVVNAARVSMDKESEWKFDGDGKHVLSEKDQKLIKYLARNKHISPFGHCFASFRVSAPIFVARQLFKHKFLRQNEVSRRYVDAPPKFHVPDAWRLRAECVKQGSSSEVLPDVLEDGFCPSEEYQNLLVQCEMLYRSFLQRGICPEQARMVLPQSMMTEWIWSGSLDAWVDMCRGRLDPHAQLETRIAAEQVDKVMRGLFPHAWSALLN